MFVYVKADSENVDRELGTIMLQATGDGVIARDVTVDHYLRVGEHARFEDYSNGTDGERTACFWV